MFFDPEIPGVVFILDDFDQYAEQTSMSRIYGGVHYRFSNEAANLMGRRIGELAVRQFLRPLPRDPAPSGAASSSSGSRGGG